jgi:hypothetical protein
MSILDRLLGRGGSSVTVPVMDGPFLPNQKLETAEVASALAEADNLTVSRSALYASSGAKLLKSVDGVAFELVEEFPQAISAAGGSETSLAIGIDGEGLVVRGGPFDGVAVRGHGDDLRCLTAIAWLNDHEIIVCNGSAMARTNEWRRSLMQLDASGSVTKVDLKTGTTARLADGLAWPAGIAAGGSGLFVSESWRHRIVSMPLAGGSARTVLGNLPAYPARIAAAVDGGYWISFYSVRNQLVEFILQEPRYRTRMIAEIAEEFWMAPSLSSGNSFREPMQGSQLKQMGILKPYSASRSYGLVAYCDAQMTPVGSFHSRSDGRRHGTVASCEFGDSLLVASRGSNSILSIKTPMNTISE